MDWNSWLDSTSGVTEHGLPNAMDAAAVVLTSEDEQEDQPLGLPEPPPAAPVAPPAEAGGRGGVGGGSGVVPREPAPAPGPAAPASPPSELQAHPVEPPSPAAPAAPDGSWGAWAASLGLAPPPEPVTPDPTAGAVQPEAPPPAGPADPYARSQQAAEELFLMGRTADLGAAAKDRNTFLGNVARGAGVHTASLIGSLIGAVSAASEAMGAGQVDWSRTAESAIQEWAGEAFGYDDAWVTDDPLGALKNGDIGTVLLWGLQQGLVSLPEMATLIVGGGVGIALRTGTVLAHTNEIASARAENDGRAEVDATDVAVGGVASALVLVLDRAGVEKILNPAVTEKLGRAGVANFLKATGVAAGSEAVTEGVQEQIQYAAETTGTEKGYDFEEGAGRTVLGSIAGGATGGAIGGGLRAFGHGRESITPSYYERLGRVESSGRADAKNAASSASGVYQFTDGTWLEQAAKIWPTETDEQLLARKGDPQAQQQVVERFTQGNAKKLTAAGFDPDPASLYLAHFLGPAGAIQVLRNPEKAITDLVTPAALEANPTVFRKMKTGEDIIAWAGRKMAGVAPGLPQSSSPPGPQRSVANTVSSAGEQSEVLGLPAPSEGPEEPPADDTAADVDGEAPPEFDALSHTADNIAGDELPDDEAGSAPGTEGFGLPVDDDGEPLDTGGRSDEPEAVDTSEAAGDDAASRESVVARRRIAQEIHDEPPKPVRGARLIEQLANTVGTPLAKRMGVSQAEREYQLNKTSTSPELKALREEAKALSRQAGDQRAAARKKRTEALAAVSKARDLRKTDEAAYKLSAGDLVRGAREAHQQAVELKRLAAAAESEAAARRKAVADAIQETKDKYRVDDRVLNAAELATREASQLEIASHLASLGATVKKLASLRRTAPFDRVQILEQAASKARAAAMEAQAAMRGVKESDPNYKAARDAADNTAAAYEEARLQIVLEEEPAIRDAAKMDELGDLLNAVAHGDRRAATKQVVGLSTTIANLKEPLLNALGIEHEAAIDKFISAALSAPAKDSDGMRAAAANLAAAVEPLSKAAEKAQAALAKKTAATEKGYEEATGRQAGTVTLPAPGTSVSNIVTTASESEVRAAHLRRLGSGKRAGGSVPRSAARVVGVTINDAGDRVPVVRNELDPAQTADSVAPMPPGNKTISRAKAEEFWAGNPDAKSVSLMYSGLSALSRNILISASPFGRNEEERRQLALDKVMKGAPRAPSKSVPREDTRRALAKKNLQRAKAHHEVRAVDAARRVGDAQSAVAAAQATLDAATEEMKAKIPSRRRKQLRANVSRARRRIAELYKVVLANADRSRNTQFEALRKAEARVLRDLWATQDKLLDANERLEAARASEGELRAQDQYPSKAARAKLWKLEAEVRELRALRRTLEEELSQLKKGLHDVGLDLSVEDVAYADVADLWRDWQQPPLSKGDMVKLQNAQSRLIAYEAELAQLEETYPREVLEELQALARAEDALEAAKAQLSRLTNEDAAEILKMMESGDVAAQEAFIEAYAKKHPGFKQLEYLPKPVLSGAPRFDEPDAPRKEAPTGSPAPTGAKSPHYKQGRKDAKAFVKAAEDGGDAAKAQLEAALDLIEDLARARADVLRSKRPTKMKSRAMPAHAKKWVAKNREFLKVEDNEGRLATGAAQLPRMRHWLPIGAEERRGTQVSPLYRVTGQTQVREDRTMLGRPLPTFADPTVRAALGRLADVLHYEGLLRFDGDPAAEDFELTVDEARAILHDRGVIDFLTETAKERGKERPPRPAQQKKVGPKVPAKARPKSETGARPKSETKAPAEADSRAPKPPESSPAGAPTSDQKGTNYDAKKDISAAAARKLADEIHDRGHSGPERAAARAAARSGAGGRVAQSAYGSRLPEAGGHTSVWAAGRKWNERLTDEQAEGADRVLDAYLADNGDPKHGIPHAFGLLDGTGFGKTRQLLAAAAQIAGRAKKKVVILVPRAASVGEYKKQARAMDPSFYKDYMEGPNALVVILPYDTFSKSGVPSAEAVFLDEAQNFKDADGIRYKQFNKQVLSKGTFTVLASATPMDTANALVAFGPALLGVSGKQIRSQLHLKERTINGKIRMVFGIDPAQAILKVADWVERAYQSGRLLSRYLPALAPTQIIDVTRAVTPAALQKLERSANMVEERFYGAKHPPRLQIMREQNRLGEYAKAAATATIAVELMKKGEKTGRKPQIIFMSETVTPPEEASLVWGIGTTPLTIAEQVFKEAGLKVAVVHSKTKANMARELPRILLAFQRGEIDAIVTTPQSLGTGVDLHTDVTIENARPKILALNHPTYSGDVFAQVLGRVDRRTSDLTRPPMIFAAQLPGHAPDARMYSVVALKTALLKVQTRTLEAEERAQYKSLIGQIGDSADDLFDMPIGVPEREGRIVDRAARDGAASGGVRGGLMAIAAAHPDPDIRNLAKMLARALPDTVRLRAMETGEAPEAAARYRRRVVAGRVEHEILWRPQSSGAAQALLHEAAHAAGSMAIDGDPKLRAELEKIRQRLIAAGVDGNTVSNVHEMWAEAMSDPAVRAVMGAVRVSETTTLLGRLFASLLRALRRFGVPIPRPESTLDALMKLRVERSNSEARFLARMERVGGPSAVTMFAPIGQGLAERSRLQRVKDMAANSVMRTAELRGASEAVLSTTLALRTLAQIRSSFDSWFDGGLRKYEKSIQKLQHHVATQQEQATEMNTIWALWEEASTAANGRRTMDELMRMATYYNYDPGKPPANPSTEQQAVAPAIDKLWKQVATTSVTRKGERYNGQRIFRMVRDYYSRMLKMQRYLLQANYVQGRTMPPGAPFAGRNWQAEADDPTAWADMDKLFLWLQADSMNDVVADAKKAGVPVSSKIDVDWRTRLGDPNFSKRLAASLGVLGRRGVDYSTQEIHELTQQLRDMLPSDNQVYFPLNRYGDYVVTFKYSRKFATEAERDRAMADEPGLRLAEGDPLHLVAKNGIRQFETRAEADAARKEMAQAPGYTNISDIMLRRELVTGKVDTGISDRMFGRILEKIDEHTKGTATHSIVRAAVRSSLLALAPSESVAKARIRRQHGGVPGAADQMRRNFAVHALRHSYYLAALRYGTETYQSELELIKHAEAGGDRASEKQAVVAELQKRAQASMADVENHPWVQSAVNIGYVWFLLGPSYSLLNSTQPLMLTLPHLASRNTPNGAVGMGRATAALWQAYAAVGRPIMSELARTKGSLSQLRKILNTSVFDPDNFRVFDRVLKHVESRDPALASVLKVLDERGLIGNTATMDLRGKADMREGRGSYFLEWTRVLPQITEVLNRATSAAAAYYVGRDAGLTGEALSDFVADTVDTTQFNYAGWNKNRLFQVQALRPTLMFKQYIQHMYYYLITSAYRAVAGETKAARLEAGRGLLMVLGAHGVLAGLAGAMFEPIKWAIGLVAWLFGDDDEPWDTETELKNLMADMFGPQLGDYVSGGLPRAAGIDLSSRLGLQNMLFFDGPNLEDGDSLFQTVGELAAGPLGSIAANGIDAIGRAGSGDVYRALEKATPKLARDVIGALRMSQEGLLDYSGKEILGADQLSPIDLFVKAVGFSPATVTRAYEARGAFYTRDEHIRGRRQALLDRYWRATPSERVRMRTQDIPEFNRAHPIKGYRIDGETLTRSMRSRREVETKNRLGPAFVQPAQKMYYREELRFSPLLEE